ncbi:hypothetical protein FJZ53_04940 [Candidatus Woesearchaeota archaeon]|nr:hypothetical protein [Candidatus Woesearchaeota archaeon]
MENPKIKKIINLGENIRVAELENGFSVAYENKGIGEKVCGECGHKHKHHEAVYAILKVGRSYNCYETGTGRNASFSKEAEEKVESYLSSFGPENTTDSLESKIPGLYEEATKPLGIKEYRHRDWDEIGMWSKAILYWPVSIYYAFTGNSGLYNEGLLGAVLAPFFAPYILYRLAWPSKKAKKITNKKAIIRNRAEGNAALTSYCEMNPKKFNSLDIVFDNNVKLSEHHLTRITRYGKEKYWTAKWFIKMDPELKKRIYETFEAIDLEDEKYYNSYLETERADHSALMKACYDS